MSFVTRDMDVLSLEIKKNIFNFVDTFKGNVIPLLMLNSKLY